MQIKDGHEDILCRKCGRLFCQLCLDSSLEHRNPFLSGWCLQCLTPERFRKQSFVIQKIKTFKGTNWQELFSEQEERAIYVSGLLDEEHYLTEYRYKKVQLYSEYLDKKFHKKLRL